ncbi:hypothetical protein [uncultured Amnibacterium sp.]|uniref:hypothetical protein n=1 Tax=uncultured Amnibacterium sp. TaxID=1631851 RepID=UPI0035CC50DE
MSDAPAPRGRTVITARAIEKVVRAVTADQFGVDSKRVSAEMNDDAGRLDLAVKTPIRVVSIGRLQDDPHSVDRSGGSITDRAERAEAVIIDRVSTITGSAVTRLALRLTGADIKQERRVR